jgi:small GTP-binding protein
MISQKIVLIGDFSTGKTSLIRRFVDNQFDDKYLTTLGVKISKKIVSKLDTIVQCLIWDIEGGTTAKPLNTTYLRGMHGAIVVADITREETINHIDLYISAVHSISEKTPIVIALNKSDKVDLKESVEILEKLKDQYKNRYNIFLTSAKSGLHVEDLFDVLVKDMIKSR